MDPSALVITMLERVGLARNVVRIAPERQDEREHRAAPLARGSTRLEPAANSISRGGAARATRADHGRCGPGHTSTGAPCSSLSMPTPSLIRTRRRQSRSVVAMSLRSQADGHDRRDCLRRRPPIAERVVAAVGVGEAERRAVPVDRARLAVVAGQDHRVPLLGIVAIDVRDRSARARASRWSRRRRGSWATTCPARSAGTSGSEMIALTAALPTSATAMSPRRQARGGASPATRRPRPPLPPAGPAAARPGSRACRRWP